MNRRLAITLTMSLMAAASGEASACDWMRREQPTSAELRAEAQAAIDRSTAIIDAEVIRQRVGDQAALVRAVRVLKGPDLEQFVIGQRGSCWEFDIGKPGKRIRMFLTGGPDVWFFEETFAEPDHEDALLGSDRNRDWLHGSDSVQ